MPRIVVVIGYVASLVVALVGAWLAWRGIAKSGPIAYRDLETAERLRDRLGVGGRLGVLLVVLAALFSTASSIASLYVSV